MADPRKALLKFAGTTSVDERLVKKVLKKEAEQRLLGEALYTRRDWHSRISRRPAGGYILLQNRRRVP